MTADIPARRTVARVVAGIVACATILTAALGIRGTLAAPAAADAATTPALPPRNTAEAVDVERRLERDDVPLTAVLDRAPAFGTARTALSAALPGRELKLFRGLDFANMRIDGVRTYATYHFIDGRLARREYRMRPRDDRPSALLRRFDDIERVLTARWGAPAVDVAPRREDNPGLPVWAALIAGEAARFTKRRVGDTDVVLALAAEAGRLRLTLTESARSQAAALAARGGGDMQRLPLTPPRGPAGDLRTAVAGGP